MVNFTRLTASHVVINSHAYLLCNQSRHAFRFVCTKRAHDNNCRISNLVYIRGV